MFCAAAISPRPGSFPVAPVKPVVSRSPPAVFPKLPAYLLHTASAGSDAWPRRKVRSARPASQPENSVYACWRRTPVQDGIRAQLFAIAGRGIGKGNPGTLNLAAKRALQQSLYGQDSQVQPAHCVLRPCQWFHKAGSRNGRSSTEPASNRKGPRIPKNLSSTSTEARKSGAVTAAKPSGP